MKPVNCLIIDDEPIARSGMREYVNDVDFLHLAGMAKSADEAVQILKTFPVDIIFLDIELPRISGLAFLRSLQNPPAVIITTAYPDYALEGFELDVVDYLLKPIAFSRFLKAVQKATDLLHLNNKITEDSAIQKNYFFIKVNSRYEKVMYDEVLFVEALQNYVAVHVAGKKMLSYIPISSLEKQLPSGKFFRVHKSYIVSLSKISSLEANQVLIGTTSLPISRRVKDDLQKIVLENNLLKR